MSVETVIQFLIQHNAGLIEALIALILLSALFLGYRNLKAPEEAQSSAPAHNLAELEETLKKLLEKASLVPATTAAPAGGGGPSPELLAQIDSLKKALEDRQSEIEKLKSDSANLGAAASAMNTEERAALDAQIKELQGKLTEYEIISEDIADLSFYKEENAKLQKQLEAAKSGTPVAAAPTHAAPAKPEPEIVGRSKATAAAVAEEAPATPPPAAETPPVAENTVDNDLMAEFSKAVEEQNATMTANSEEPDLGSMDMDKMLAEADGVAETDAAAAPDNALEQSLDADKLMQEADALTNVKPEDKNLMNEFENFVKKGS